MLSSEMQVTLRFAGKLTNQETNSNCDASSFSHFGAHLFDARCSVFLTTLQLPRERVSLLRVTGKQRKKERNGKGARFNRNSPLKNWSHSRSRFFAPPSILEKKIERIEQWEEKSGPIFVTTETAEFACRHCQNIHLGAEQKKQIDSSIIPRFWLRPKPKKWKKWRKRKIGWNLVWLEKGRRLHILSMNENLVKKGERFFVAAEEKESLSA